MSADGVTRVCDRGLARAAQFRDELRALHAEPIERLTYDSTLRRFDDIIEAIEAAAAFPYLMAVAHPDAKVREAAKQCEPRVDKFQTELWLDASVADVLRRYQAKAEPLEGEQKKLLEDVMRDFRRNGLELSKPEQARLREINEDITSIGQDFMSAIGASKGSILIDPSSLEGLSEDYKKSHPPNEDGKVEITTDYPDYFPFVKYAEDREAALELYREFVNRGGIGNVERLEKLLLLRREKAELLGYESWAHYAIEPRMAGDADAVREFLDKLQTALRDPATNELKEFMEAHIARGGKAGGPLLPPDRYYLEDRIRSDKYDFDSQALSEYFELSAVKQGLMDITARMYNLEYQKLDEPVWHPDVEVYSVVSEGQPIGKFYLDLHPRQDKYKHAAMFTIRSAKRWRDGTYQTPIAALECNFPKPGEQPALMSHEEVVTFFHEFGHVLHHLLTESELASYAGTNTSRDFVEAPSQMFEEWAWDRDVLNLFAKHHETGKPIPDKLYDAMTRARRFGRALSTQRQLFLARLDFEYHARKPGFDTTLVLKEIQNAESPFKYVPGTHFQSSFGHLIGYDAGYYGYQWALSLSRDVLTRFAAEGYMNPKTAADWRASVLAVGGGDDESAMIQAFLGRPPSEDAYIRYLRGDD